MKIARGLTSIAMSVAISFLALSASAERKEGKAANRGNRQMSGVVDSVDLASGMIMVRLDNGEMFSAPMDKVHVRQMQRAEAGRTGSNAATAPAKRKLAVAVESVPVGSRVLIRQKLDRDGNLKRVNVRIVEQ